MADRKINYEINLEINRASVEALKKNLGSIEKSLTGSASGNQSNPIHDLRLLLNTAWNPKLNQLDLSKVNNEITKTYHSVDGFKQALEKLGPSGAQAYNEFSKVILNTNLQLTKSNKLLDDMADTMAKTVKWGVASRIMNNMVGSIEKAWSYSIKLNSSLNDIRIVTGKSADEMNRFAIQANAAAKALGASTRDYTEASLIYYQQGLTDQEAQRRAEITLKAANVTGQSAQQVSEQLTAVWNGYNVTIEESELYIDKLAAVAASTAADLEELSTGMSKVASAANTMGVDIDQLNAQMATIISVTRQAPESVGTALRTIYARMGDIEAGLDEETSLGNYTSKMAELGVNVLDANGKLRDMGEVIEEIGGKWESMSREQQIALSQTMAGTRQYNNLLTLFENWDMYTEALETSANAAGTLQKQQDIYMESTEAHLQRLSTEAEKTYDILFDQDTVNGFADALTNMLGIFNNFLSGLGGGTNSFVYFGALLSDIFNKQIAGGISNSIQRLQDFKNNAATLNLLKEVSNAGLSTVGGGGADEVYSGLFKRMDALLGISKSISNEEFNSLNLLSQKIAHYQELLNILGSEGTINKETIEELENELALIKEKRNIIDEIYNKKQGTANLETLLNKNNRELLDEQQLIQLQEIKKRYSANEVLNEKDKETILRIQKDLQQKILLVMQQQNGALELAKENMGMSAAQAEALMDKFNAMSEEGLALGKQKQDISYLVQGLSLSIQMITSFSGVVKTIFDENLSSAEKMSQIMSVIAANAVTIAVHAKDFKNIGESLAGFLTNPMTLKVVAVIAAVAAIAAFINEIDLLLNKERVLNQELEQNKKAVEESRKAYEDLNNTVSNYKSAYEGIKKLTEGTVEFYEAVLKSNEEAKKLIETLELQAGSQYQINSNGLIEINEEAIRQGLYQQNQQWARAQLNQSLTEFSIKDRQDQEKINNLIRQFQSNVNKNIPGDYGISYEQAKTMIDSFDLSSENIVVSIGELQDTSNKNLKELQNKIGTFNQQELSKIDESVGSMSEVITGEMSEVIDVIKAKQAEDRASYRLIGSEAINAYATEEQKEALKNLPDEVANILNDTAGEGIVTNQLQREASGLGGRNVTNSFERIVGLYANSPLADINSFINPIAAAVNWIGDKIVKEQRNYNETQSQNQEVVEENLTKWTNSLQDYLQKASVAGYAGNAGGQYIASAQFEAETFGSVKQSTVDMMTASELQFALENSDKLKESLLETNQTIDEYIKKIEETQGPLDQWGRNQSRIASDLENYKNSLKTTAEELEVSAKTMELYGDAANNANKTNGKLDATTAEQIKNLAKFNKTYNEAIKIYNDNEDALRDYTDAIQNGQMVSFEAAEGAAAVVEKLEEMGLSLNGQQLANNLETINTLLNGTEEEANQAYNELLNISRLNFLEGYESFFESVENGVQGFVDYLAGLQPGAQIADNYAEALTKMINDSHMTADEIYNTLNALHLQGPNMDVQLEKKHELIHGGYTQAITYDAEIPIMSGFGSEPTVKRMKFRIFKDVPAEYADYYTLGEGQTFQTSGAPNFSKSPSNARSGSGGRSGGGGGGSSKQPNTIDPIEKEKDRYHDVNIQLKEISNDLDKLEKQKDKLFGDDLIENLNSQLELLNDQIDTTNEKMKIAEGEAQELRGKLAASGVTFNEDGTIANYAQAYQAQLNYVNGIVNQYNSMGAEAQEGFKDTVEKAKENFEKFVDNISRYDEVITDLIPGLAADIQEAIDEQIDIQIEEFDMEIEIRLDLAEAERDWNDFRKKIIDGIEDDDILGNAAAKLLDFSSYYKDDNTGAIQSLRKQIDDTLAELYQMDETGQSRVYGDNRTGALEDLKKYYDELMKQMNDVLKLQEEINDSYLDMMDEAQDKFDEQIESYEVINELIEHDMDVISLVYGDEAYHQLSNYYNQQQANFNAQLDFQRQQAEFWKAQMDAVEEGTEAWDAAKEKWVDSVKDLDKLIEESIENLQDKYLNAINEIFQDLNNKVTDGLGLDYVEEEWNLINKNADQYLDTINQLYGIQSLENKYLDAINGTDNVNAQKQLKKIMDDELANLRERDKLTEYDIERANKKYEIALKQIALEEAQQNKTQMRLRRDSQGNYRYEYISDMEEVQQLQNDLDDLYNSLYNFDKENYADNLNELYGVWNEFQEKMAEAAQINDPEARAERELLIQQQYGDLINGLVEQNETIRGNLYDSAFDDLARLYDEDKNNFLEMTQQEQDALMNDLIPYWDAGVQHMADVFAGEGGFIPVCEEALDDLHEATKDYENDLKEIENTANISFDNVSNRIDNAIDKTKELLDNNDNLINSYYDEMDAIAGVVNELNNLVDTYDEAARAAKDAEEAAYNYWSEQQRQAADAARKDQEEKARKAAEQAAKNTPTPTPKVTTPAPAAQSSGGDGVPRVGDVVDFISGIYHADSYGGGASGSMGLGGKVKITIVKEDGRPYPIHIATLNGGPLGWLSRAQISGYDTGGYTGTWGNNGRLALLHQKELVLNQQDTKNILGAVNIMRTVTETLGNKVFNRLAMATIGNNFGQNGLNNILDQNVHIDAQFPNVTSSHEIEDALNNLVNMAAQRVQNKER